MPHRASSFPIRPQRLSTIPLKLQGPPLTEPANQSSRATRLGEVLKYRSDCSSWPFYFVSLSLSSLNLLSLSPLPPWSSRSDLRSPSARLVKPSDPPRPVLHRVYRERDPSYACECRPSLPLCRSPPPSHSTHQPPPPSSRDEQPVPLAATHSATHTQKDGATADAIGITVGAELSPPIATHHPPQGAQRGDRRAPQAARALLLVPPADHQLLHP